MLLMGVLLYKIYARITESARKRERERAKDRKRASERVEIQPNLSYES